MNVWYIGSYSTRWELSSTAALDVQAHPNSWNIWPQWQCAHTPLHHLVSSYVPVNHSLLSPSWTKTFGQNLFVSQNPHLAIIWSFTVSKAFGSWDPSTQPTCQIFLSDLYTNIVLGFLSYLSFFSDSFSELHFQTLIENNKNMQ